MDQSIIAHVEEAFRKTNVPEFRVGDTVDVHQKIVEGNKSRIQVFTGVVIARRGGGLSEQFTVRRIVADEGVERIFMLHSPLIAKIEVKRHGKARRAKLYFLRQRVGKARRLREVRKSGRSKGAQTDEQAKAPAAETPADEPVGVEV